MHFTVSYQGTKIEKLEQGKKSLQDWLPQRKIDLLLNHLRGIPSVKNRYKACNLLLALAGVNSYWCRRWLIQESLIKKGA